MKQILFVGLLILGIFGPSVTAPIDFSTWVVEESYGCGLKPLKPLIPLGCKDLVAQCLCDSRGRNCEWTWICTKR